MDKFTPTTNYDDERCVRVSELMAHLRKFIIPETAEESMMYYTDADFGQDRMARRIMEMMGETP